MKEDEIIKSEMIRCGKRTYFFDIKETSKKDKFLRITESRYIKEEDIRKRSEIVVFEEDMDKFKEAFGKISEEI